MKEEGLKKLRNRVHCRIRGLRRRRDEEVKTIYEEKPTKQLVHRNVIKTEKFYKVILY